MGVGKGLMERPERGGGRGMRGREMGAGSESAPGGKAGSGRAENTEHKPLKCVPVPSSLCTVSQ